MRGGIRRWRRMRRVNGGIADEDIEDDNEDERRSCGGHLDRGRVFSARPAALSDSGSGGEGPRRFRQSQTPGFGDRILGKEGAALLRSGDADQDAENLKEFNEAAAALTAIDDGPNGAKLLRVGNNGWTLPLPLVKTDAGWKFDPVLGKEEMTNRRIGYDELSAIAACEPYVEAQDEYFRLDRDGNGLREYATKFISTPDKHDGLYWQAESQADISPLDGLVEDANLAERSNEKPEPYNGYYFRILTAQGPAAPGGAYSYLINGHMIAGHAMVAWPATYGDSGVETLSAARTAPSTRRTSGRTPPLSAPR